jgi:hypothetical protein
MKGAGVQINQQDAGDLNEHGGIIAGRVVQFADALETEPTAVFDAMQAAGVEPMVDTAKANPGANKKRDRPTAPSMRCLAMTRRDFARVLAQVQQSGESTSAQSRKVAAVRG